jgi:STE24 endopeptidase
VLRLAFIAAYVLELVADLTLSWLNLRHQARTGGVVPTELAGVVEPETLRKISSYSRDRGRFGMVARALGGGVYALFLFAGPLSAYDRFIAGLSGSAVARGVAFVVGLMAIRAVLEIPISYYGTFVIEARHGFNRMSRALFFGDLVKSTLLSLALAAGLSALAFWVAGAAPHTWWLWVWLGFVGFSVLLTFASPYLIEPLFYKMEPLAVEGLVLEVQRLAERAGVHVGRVLTMDASRRSAHSNAYFTGLGRVKRVVLFDTLVAQMTPGEILAVLAHELGHWKKHHVRIRFVSIFVVSLGVLYAAYYFAPSPLVLALAGLDSASFPARLLLLSVLGSLFTFPLTPLASAWSRHHERQADRFAVELSGRARELADALAKLARDNLSNLHPHPLYAKFYYTHPPATERIRTLRRLADA